jgi:hypothetical protein
MFLFTTPQTREVAPTPVIDAIRDGARRTGVSFEYLLATAQRESALDPAAKARTSSATGLFQFVEQTWLATVKADGARHGLAAHAEAISVRPDGTLTVQDPAARRAILALREDPTIAAAMAGSLTQRNRTSLAGDLGREPSAPELYVAHFLGARGASELIRAAGTTPRRPAAADFPDAAAANRSIFFDRSGRARGAGEVYALLSARHAAAIDATPAFAPDKPVAFARADGPAMHGLFQTDGRRGPISETVAKLWRTNQEPGVRTAALGFFPRTGAEAEAAAEPEPAPRIVDVPLPPPRPAEPPAAAPRSGRGAVARAGKPLDLLAFMKWRQ